MKYYCGCIQEIHIHTNTSHLHKPTDTNELHIGISNDIFTQSKQIILVHT